MKSDPAKLCGEHADAIRGLIDLIENALPLVQAESSWPKAGSAQRARTMLVEAAFALGAITTVDAMKFHGVSV